MLDPVVEEAAGSGLVVDLRSSTYAAFWRPGRDLARRVATVRVLHEVGGAAHGGEPLQQGHQGPAGARAAGERSHPTDTSRPRRRLRDLGWKVELGDPGRHGQQLDVIVDDL